MQCSPVPITSFSCWWQFFVLFWFDILPATMLLILWFSNMDFFGDWDEAIQYNFPLELRFCCHLIVSFLEINNLFKIYKLSLSCCAVNVQHALVLKELSTFVEGDRILGTLGARKHHVLLNQAKVLLSLLVCFSALLYLALVDFLLCYVSALSGMCNLSENGLVRFDTPFSHHSIKTIPNNEKVFTVTLSLLLLEHLNLQMAL